MEPTLKNGISGQICRIFYMHIFGERNVSDFVNKCNIKQKKLIDDWGKTNNIVCVQKQDNITIQEYQIWFWDHKKKYWDFASFDSEFYLSSRSIEVDCNAGWSENTALLQQL